MASESGQGQDEGHSGSQRTTIAFNGVAFVPGFSPLPPTPIVGIYSAEYIRDYDALLFSGDPKVQGLYDNYIRDNPDAAGGARPGASVGNNQTQAQREKKEREKQQQWQQLLDQLNRRIEFLENQIKEYDKQINEYREKIEAVDALIALEQLDQVDPTNQKHIELLIKAGFTDPDEWGTLTREDYQKRREEYTTQVDILTQKRDEAKTELNEVREYRDDINQKIDSNPSGPIDLRDNPSPMIDAYAAKNPEFDRANVTADQADEIRYLHYLEDIQAKRPKNIEHEAAWFKEGVQKFEPLKGSPGYNQNLDSLIDKLAENTKDALLNDQSLDQDVRARLAIDKFESIYTASQEARGTEVYNEVLQTEMENLKGLESILLAQNNLPEDARNILLQQQLKSTENVTPTNVAINLPD